MTYNAPHHLKCDLEHFAKRLASPLARCCTWRRWRGAIDGDSTMLLLLLSPSLLSPLICSKPMMIFGMLCQVLHLAALEGRTDGRSQRTIIGHLAPRHLAIVRGSDEVRPRVGLIPPDPACRRLPRPLRLLHAALAARTYLKMLEPPPAAPLRIPQSNSRGLWCVLTLDFRPLIGQCQLCACLPACRRRAAHWRRTAAGGAGGGVSFRLSMQISSRRSTDCHCLPQARGVLAAHCRAELAAVRCAVHVPAAGQALDISSGCASLRRVAYDNTRKSFPTAGFVAAAVAPPCGQRGGCWTSLTAAVVPPRQRRGRR